MFIKLGRRKALAVQAIVRLLVVSLSINLLIVQMASGEDAVVDNNIGAQSDSWKPTHEEKLSPHQSLHDPLREMMEAERGYPRSRDEYLRYHKQGKDKKTGRENLGCLPSAEEVTGKGVEGALTAKTTWATESADAPKFFILFRQGPLPSMWAAIPILSMEVITCIMHTMMAPHGITKQPMHHLM